MYMIGIRKRLHLSLCARTQLQRYGCLGQDHPFEVNSNLSD